MKVCLRGHKPFAATKPGINAIATLNPQVYRQLITGLQQDDDNVQLFDSTARQVYVAKAINFVGDVWLNQATVLDNMTPVLNYVAAQFTPNERDEINRGWQKMSQIVMDNLLKVDLPLMINDECSMKRILKSVSLNFERSIVATPYDIIELAVKVQQLCMAPRVLVVSNLAHYLTKKEMAELLQLTLGTQTTILTIEFTPPRIPALDAVHLCGYIDDDLIDWY